MILYSADAEADRAFFRDVLKFPSVDAGHGWLIFALPPSELAVHTAERGGQHEIYLMCEDVAAAMSQLASLGVECSALSEQRWGSITTITLPGGGKLGLYQPKHPRP